jgi:hypothetical protein
MLIADGDLNGFMCKDILLRSLAIKHVVEKGKKQDIALGHKESCFSGGLTHDRKSDSRSLLDS